MGKSTVKKNALEEMSSLVPLFLRVYGVPIWPNYIHAVIVSESGKFFTKQITKHPLVKLIQLEK